MKKVGLNLKRLFAMVLAIITFVVGSVCTGENKTVYAGGITVNTAIDSICNTAAGYVGWSRQTFLNNGYSDIASSWCAWFLINCARQVGVADVFGTSYSTPDLYLQMTDPNGAYNAQGFYYNDMIGYVKNREYYKYGTSVSKSSFVPQKGDIICFLWPESRNKYSMSHMGLVVDYNASTGVITFIHGNTISSGESYSTVKKTSTSNSYYARSVVGFIRPNYAGSSAIDRCASGHSYGGWITTKAATCVADGEQTRSCDVCGKVETRRISATGEHTAGDWIVDKAATTSADGSRHKECMVCGYIMQTEIIDKLTPQIDMDADTSKYYNVTTNGGSWDGTHYYLPSGQMVRNSFFSDGTYTYYLQADGTPMKDRLTYHPDGVHVIYFDANGHEVFSDFAHVTKSIAGTDVDDMCCFGVYGYMYVDTLTYDKAGTRIYYVNPYGVLERNGWFRFSGYEFDAGLGFSGKAGGYGYANGDGSLIVNSYMYDWNGNLVYMQGDGHMLQ